MTACTPESAELQFELPCTAHSVSEARQRIGELARSVGAPVENVQLAVSEAVGNAVVHAFRDVADGRIMVAACLESGELVVTVADEGTGMRPHVESPGLGLGISLITNLAREVHLDSSARGTRMTMTFSAGAC